MEKIKFQLEDGTEVEFYVEEQTRIGGTAYLLVSDSLDDEATAYIFKDVSAEESQEACYEMVEDEDELQAVFKVFEQMLDDDVDLENVKMKSCIKQNTRNRSEKRYGEQQEISMEV